MGTSSTAPSTEPYIYADNAANTPLSPKALEAMMPLLTTEFGNPGGIHRIAREAALTLGDARSRMARALDAERAEEIYFTSCGSESDNWVLRGAVQRVRDQYGPDARPRVITSAIEHHAILHCCRALEHQGVEVAYLPVDKLGRVRTSDLEAALAANERANRAAGVPAPGTAIVSIMLANNEVGTVQDIAGLSAIAHDHGAPFHTDAVQAVGHIPVDARSLGVDALSLSSHKFHGPRGAGALYLREGFSIPPLIEGGAQERGERAGTENLAGIVGTVTALEEACDGLAERAARIAAMRDELVRHVLAEVPGVHATGDPSTDHSIVRLRARGRRAARGPVGPCRRRRGHRLRLLDRLDRSLPRAACARSGPGPCEGRAAPLAGRHHHARRARPAQGARATRHQARPQPERDHRLGATRPRGGPADILATSITTTNFRILENEFKHAE